MGDRTAIPFCIVFADGSEFRHGDAPPAFTLRFRTRRAERRLAGFGHVALLESYFDGDVDVDGDFALSLRAAFDAGLDNDANPLIAALNRWHEWRFSNRTIRQAKANASYHYDLGLSFYEPWLDRVGMLYTCAYWREGTTTLEEAQTQQDGPRLPQGRAQGGRYLCRHRLRLRRTAVPRLGALRRDRHRHQHGDPAGRRTPVGARTAATARQDQAHRMRLSRNSRSIRQAPFDRHARARRAATSFRPLSARTPTP